MDMKKYLVLALAAVLAVSLMGCGSQTIYQLEITIPAGSTGEFVYTEEEISPLRDKVILMAGAGLDRAQVLLSPVEVREENAYEPMNLTKNAPLTLDAEKGGWFKVGVSMQNPSDSDITVVVQIEGVEIRIA